MIHSMSEKMTMELPVLMWATSFFGRWIGLMCLSILTLILCMVYYGIHKEGRYSAPRAIMAAAALLLMAWAPYIMTYAPRP